MASGSARDTALRHHLDDRQRLIIRLMRLHAALTEGHQDIARLARQRFCEGLTDYLTSGYFRLYGAFRPSPRQSAELGLITDRAMHFVERFAGHDDAAAVKPALADLALDLERRFEVEDELLSGPGEPLAASA